MYICVCLRIHKPTKIEFINLLGKGLYIPVKNSHYEILFKVKNNEILSFCVCA